MLVFLFVFRRDDLLAQWDEWMEQMKPQADCVLELEGSHQADTVVRFLLCTCVLCVCLCLSSHPI